jgi:predicted Zn-ribbon and HTH transcriptional regulator
MPEIAQPIETSTEFFSHGIIGIIVKTLVLPKTIYCGRNLALGSKAAEGRQVLIPNLKTRQGCRKDISIELGISSGARNGTNVNEELNVNRSQRPHKLLDAMRGMANRIKRDRHTLVPIRPTDYDKCGPVGSCRHGPIDGD